MSNSASFNGYSNLPETIYVEHGMLHPEINMKAHDVPPEAVSNRSARASKRSDMSSISSDPKKAEETVNKRQTTRIRLIWIAVCIICMILIGVGLGVGLGIGLEQEDTAQHSQPAKQPDIKPSLSYSSTRGAFNGTGIVALPRNSYLNLTSPPPDIREDSGDGTNMIVFYQHHTGDLRYMSCEWPDIWRGGTVYESIAVDAKNGTPLSVIGHPNNGVLQTHLFYIDKDNFVRQRMVDNSSYSWVDGPLSAMNIKVLDSDHVGLTACFYMGPIANADLTGTTAVSGVRLFVASGETTFEQLAWRPGMTKWIWEQSWQNMNGHATPGCFNWGSGQTTYTMFVDLNDNVELYWKDTGGTENTKTHPINVWTKSSVNLGMVDPTMGLAYRSLVYGRLHGSGVHGWNISFAAENSTVAGSQLNVVDGQSPVSGSQISVWSNPGAKNPPDVLALLYQTEGDDITMYAAVPSTGIWNETRLPIPDD